MKTRSVKSSQVSELSIVTGDTDGEGDARSRGSRQGPMAPRSSQAEAAPGPPLIANVSGRLAGSVPSRMNAVVAISALGARLSASLKRIGPAIALKRRLRPESSIVWEVVAAEGRELGATAVDAGAWPESAFCFPAFAAGPTAVSAAGGSSAAAGEVAAKPKRPAANHHFKMLGIDFIETVLPPQLLRKFQQAADVAHRARNLQGSHTAGRDKLVSLTKRMETIRRRAMPETWLFPDLKSKRELEAEAPSIPNTAGRRNRPAKKSDECARTGSMASASRASRFR